MDPADKTRIEQTIELRKRAHSFYSKNSRVYNAFLDMEKNTYTDGALRKKEKELIAAGISVAINCESCMEWHIKQALELGASENEIVEAVEVGMEMSGGPGTVAARFAMSVLDYYRR